MIEQDDLKDLLHWHLLIVIIIHENTLPSGNPKIVLSQLSLAANLPIFPGYPHVREVDLPHPLPQCQQPLSPHQQRKSFGRRQVSPSFGCLFSGLVVWEHLWRYRRKGCGNDGMATWGACEAEEG